MTEIETARAREQAKAQLESILEMVKAFEEEEEIDGQDPHSRIAEDPLSVEVRTDWHSPGGGNDKPTEYRILLCTGGPAVRIVGGLDTYSQPETAKLEYQDWFTPWIRYGDTTDADDEALLTYARQFYYGE